MQLRSIKSWTIGAAFAAAFIALAGIANPAGAALVTVTSADFSIGYGATAFSGTSVPWTTTETSDGTPVRTIADFTAGAPYSPAFNTPVTQGAFSFTVAAASTSFTSGGPKFVNRVLVDGSSNVLGDTLDFSPSITAAYLPALPVGASNPQITLNITALSIWAIKHPSFGTSDLNWNETTAGHTSSSSLGVTLTSTTSYDDADLYKQLLWNPGDFAVAGASSTRTFTLGSGGENPIDGLDILGNITLTYEEIPEPASLGLLGLGGLLLFGRRRR